MRYAKCLLRTQNVDIFAQHCGRRKPNYTDKNAHVWWSFTICSRCNQMKFPTFQCYQTNSKRLILYLLTISSLLLCSYYVYQSFYSAKVVIYFAFCVYCHCKLPYCFEQSGRHCFRKDCQIGVFTTLIYRDLKALK